MEASPNPALATAHPAMRSAIPPLVSGVVDVALAANVDGGDEASAQRDPIAVAEEHGFEIIYAE